MDAVSIVGLLGFVLTVGDFMIRGGHHVDKLRLAFRRQQSEYDVMRYLMKEAVDTVVSDGAPSPAIQACMLLCAELDIAFERELDYVGIFLNRHRHRSASGLKDFSRVFSRENDRRFAYEAFRDAVMLLRDLSYSMQTSRQLSGVRNDLSDMQDDFSSVTDHTDHNWNPLEYQKSTGINLQDVTKSKLNPLREHTRLKILEGSNYTFDATIAWARDGNICYVPIRGLWDTGSDVFVITRDILKRAGIMDDDLELLQEIPTIHGIGGGEYRPEFTVSLTWHVNRNMNSRQDTFYVVDKEKFDILVPWNLSIDARSTGYGKEGQNALILRLRKKKPDEVKREKEMEMKQKAVGSAEKQAHLVQQKQERSEKLKLREANIQSSSTSPQ